MLCTMSIGALAWTNWRFYVGGMFSKNVEYGDHFLWKGEKPEGKINSYNVFAGMDIQFSLREKFFIETGINYRHIPYALKSEMYDWEDSNPPYFSVDSFEEHDDLLSLPVRFGYRLFLNDENSFEFSLGPYAAYSMSQSYDSRLSVGLSPVITYKHRALSLSLRYENPVFVNGPRNYNTNQFAISIGINFKGRSPNWDNIARGLEIAGGVLNTAAAVYGTTSSYSGYSSSDYSSGSSYSTDSGSSTSPPGKNKDKSKDSDGGLSSSELIARNKDHATYNQIETNLIKALNGDDTGTTPSEYRARMRKLRVKWEKRGHGWARSMYE